MGDYFLRRKKGCVRGEFTQPEFGKMGELALFHARRFLDRLDGNLGGEILRKHQCRLIG